MHFLFIFALVAATYARPSEDAQWATYKSKFDKVYATAEEESARYQNWLNNLDIVKKHNAENANTYTVGINQFSDMSDEEFAEIYLSSLQVPTTKHNGPIFRAQNLTVANTVDWREKGYVTDVKNQGQCGSCYAFAATGALEGQWFAKQAELLSLSEQQIVDCSRRYGNMGCNGGWYHSAWEYLKDAQGSESQDAYPYRGRQGWCRFERSEVVAQCKGTVEVEENDEDALKEALATVGPIAVAIEVAGNFQRYTGGVYYNARCHNDQWHLNHAVLAVGYGTEDGQDYWLIKNSWSDSWGVDGYVKMARNRGNNCGVACKAAYPEV